jgi:hypothetical protein
MPVKLIGDFIICPRCENAFKNESFLGFFLQGIFEGEEEEQAINSCPVCRLENRLAHLFEKLSLGLPTE